jgi:hypothetical protein
MVEKMSKIISIHPFKNEKTRLSVAGFRFY